MEDAFVNEGKDLFLARTFVFLGPKDCFSLGSTQGERSSPGLDSFLTGASAPVRGIYRTTLGLTANLRGPFPADAPLRPLLATKDTRATKEYPWIMSFEYLGKSKYHAHIKQRFCLICVKLWPV